MEAITKPGERRKCERITTNFEVFSRLTSDLIGNVVNLSLNGMLIETADLLKPGAKLLLGFKLPNQALPIMTYSDVKWAGKISASESKLSAMGVQFINMYEAGKSKLV